MVFVFDLDDTLCDTDGYSEEYILKFFREHGLPFKQIEKNTRFAEAKFDWSVETALKWYKVFGDQMMLEFPVKEGVKEVVDNLRLQGHKVVLATARSDDWHSKPEEITMQWLKNNDLHFDEVIIGRSDKEKICREIGADVFVDDDIKIASKVWHSFNNQDGKKVFLMTSNHNVDKEIPDGIIRVENVDQILSAIDKTKVKNPKIHE